MLKIMKLFSNRYDKLSWNDLCAIAVSRNIPVPPTRMVESYERPTPREKLIAELIQQDQRKWKVVQFLISIIGIVTSLHLFGVFHFLLKKIGIK